MRLFVFCWRNYIVYCQPQVSYLCLFSICRLELKGDKNVLGEFIEFKGRHEDIQLLKSLKRSKVSRFIIQKSTLFGGFGKFYESSVLIVLLLVTDLLKLCKAIHCSG
jgi:hypothetical protein